LTGQAPSPAGTAEKAAAVFSKMEPDAMSSLYRDLSSGKPVNQTELDHIIGRMVEVGRQTNVPPLRQKNVCERFASQQD